MTLPEHLRAPISIKRAKVDFVPVGAMAPDHFLPEIASVHLTGDCDILLRPTAENLRRLLERRITTRAEKEGVLPLDLPVDAKGFPFEAWWKRRRHFKAGRARLPRASLKHVLESQRLSGRPKSLSERRPGSSAAAGPSAA